MLEWQAVCLVCFKRLPPPLRARVRSAAEATDDAIEDAVAALQDRRKR